MRRQFAPSQLRVLQCNNPVQNSSRTTFSTNELHTFSKLNNTTQSSFFSEAVSRFYSVLWCKKNTRKHKRWEGDAFLQTFFVSKSAIVYDTKGVEIARCSGLRISVICDLKEGSVITIGDKEVEITAEISEENFLIEKNSFLRSSSKLEFYPLNEVNVKSFETNYEFPRFFSVVWAKKFSRKNKAWEDDAFLKVEYSPLCMVFLKNSDGQEIARDRLISSELEAGCSHTVSGNYVEIVEEISANTFEALTSGASIKISQSLSTSCKRPAKFRPPSIIASKSWCSNNGPVQQPLYDLSSSNALVLPRPPSDLKRHEIDEDSNDSVVIDVVLDPHLSRQLRHHQRSGIIFMYEAVMGFRHADYNGVILTDEMGLGKTLQVIALIWTLLRQTPWQSERPVVRHVLILCPSSLVKNWQFEFRKWLGDERMRVYGVDSSHRISDYVAGRERYPVIIMSYEMFVRNYEVDFQDQGLKFDLLICDEAHRLKNNQVKAATFIANMNNANGEGQNRLKIVMMTGTPLQNDLKEFYTLVNLVNPGILGSESDFSRIYESAIVRSKQPDACSEEVILGEERMEELYHLTRQFILRRTQRVINRFLPLKTEFVVFCRPSALQVDAYDRAIQNMDQSIDDMPKDCVLSSLASLRKICNHPCLAPEWLESPNWNKQQFNDPTLEDQGSKLALVSCMLMGLRSLENGEKIVLVSLSTQVLDILDELCQYYGYPALRLDGSTSLIQREAVVRRFNDPRNKNDFALLLSSKAGGTGLNLIGASRIVLYDMDWNPATDLQAMSRVWRDGQHRPVFVYRLATSGTIEEKIFQRQISKRGLAEGVVDNISAITCANSGFRFKANDIRELFAPSRDVASETHDLLDCQCKGNGSNVVVNNVDAVSERTCQLGSSLDRSECFDDLMKWAHYNVENATNSLEDKLLPFCSNFFSYVFVKKFGYP